jgi:hypothetical protein
MIELLQTLGQLILFYLGIGCCAWLGTWTQSPELKPKAPIIYLWGPAFFAVDEEKKRKLHKKIFRRRTKYK